MDSQHPTKLTCILKATNPTRNAVAVCGLDLYNNTEPVFTERDHYSTHLFTERAMDIIRRHPGSTTKPLFLYLSYAAVHAPLLVPERYTDEYQYIKDQNRRNYAGMTTCMDEGREHFHHRYKGGGIRPHHPLHQARIHHQGTRLTLSVRCGKGAYGSTNKVPVHIYRIFFLVDNDDDEDDNDDDDNTMSELTCNTSQCFLDGDIIIRF